MSQGPMRVFSCVPAKKYDPYLHIHDRYELYCFLSGDADYRIESNIYPLAPGDLLLIRPSEAHCLQFHSDADYRRIVVHFSRSDLLGSEEEISHIRHFLDQRPLGQGNRFPGIMQNDPHCLTLLNKISGNTAWARKLYLTAFLHELSTKYSDTFQGTPAPRKGNITDVVRYINENLTLPLSLEHLSQTFFFSKSQLNRSFRKATGTTVWEYIQSKRLLLAKELLLNGHSPTAVSAQCCFGNYSSFFRAYKKRYGISPKDEKPRH